MASGFKTTATRKGVSRWKKLLERRKHCSRGRHKPSKIILKNIDKVDPATLFYTRRTV
jgi:hypothetical protein